MSQRKFWGSKPKTISQSEGNSPPRHLEYVAMAWSADIMAECLTVACRQSLALEYKFGIARRDEAAASAHAPMETRSVSGRSNASARLGSTCRSEYKPSTSCTSFCRASEATNIARERLLSLDSVIRLVPIRVTLPSAARAARTLGLVLVSRRCPNPLLS